MKTLLSVSFFVITMIQSGEALTSKIKKAARFVLLSLYVMTEGERYVGWKTLGAEDCQI
jgi:hypothetical protein